MAKRHEPRHKVSRRFGIDIYGAGGDALQRKLAVPPGGTRRARRRRSTFGVQLLEKQKAKALYGVLEGQFRRYVKEAHASRATRARTCCACWSGGWTTSSTGSDSRARGQWHGRS